MKSIVYRLASDYRIVNVIRMIPAGERCMGGDLICPHCMENVEYDEYFDQDNPVECSHCMEVFWFEATREIHLGFETFESKNEQLEKIRSIHK